MKKLIILRGNSGSGKTTVAIMIYHTTDNLKKDLSLEDAVKLIYHDIKN